MLERQRLRKQLLEILTGKTKAAGNVASAMFTSWDVDKLPAINISIPNEEARTKRSQIPAFDTLLTVNIEISTVLATGWDDELDTICEQIEDLILRNPAFVKEISQITSCNTSINYEADKSIARAVISLELAFSQIFEPIFDDELFERAYIKMDNKGGLIYGSNV